MAQDLRSAPGVPSLCLSRAHLQLPTALPCPDTGPAKLEPPVSPCPGPSSSVPVPSKVPNAWGWGCPGAPSCPVPGWCCETSPGCLALPPPTQGSPQLCRCLATCSCGALTDENTGIYDLYITVLKTEHHYQICGKIAMVCLQSTNYKKELIN